MMVIGRAKRVEPAKTELAHPTLWTLLYQPRRLFVRRATFQIHLWTGLILTLYLVAIAISGAILVFKTELTAAMIPQELTTAKSGPSASIPEVVRAFQVKFPHHVISTLIVPSDAIPVFQIQAADAAGHGFTVLAARTGLRMLRRNRTWLDWTRDLHYYLLLNESYGMKVNGVGGGLLLASAISGFVVWWPGVKHWKRGFLISLRSRWRRVNYDTHNATGIWTLLLVMWWAFSGLYFGWYQQVAKVINVISPTKGMTAPQLPASVYTNSATERVSLQSILTSAQKASPAGHLYSISNATLMQPALTATINLQSAGDFSHSDLVTISTVNGQVLSVWHYGSNHSAGDWVLWAMHPIHFGTLWGFTVKVVWFVLGLGVAVLSLTGVVMYWNRYLQHRFA